MYTWASDNMPPKGASRVVRSAGASAGQAATARHGGRPCPSSDRCRKTRYILEQGDRVARYSRQLLHGGVQGGQLLPGHTVVVTAEQQVGRVRPGCGRWHHDPHHRHGRAAAGRANNALIGLTRNRGLHALRIARPRPDQQRRSSLIRRPKVPTARVVPGRRHRELTSAGRLSRPAGVSIGSKTDGYRQTTCAGQRKGRRDRAAPDPGGTDSYGQIGRRRSHMSRLSLTCTMTKSSANYWERRDGYGS